MNLRQRQPRETDAAFLAFVRGRPCCVCDEHPRVEAAHIRIACPERGKRETGAAEKPSDRWAVPLCRNCHREGPEAQHRIGEKKFWRRVEIDPFSVAVALYAEFSAGAGKRPERRERKPKRRQRTRPKRAVRKVAVFAALPSRFRRANSRPKRAWPKQQLRSASRWPKGRKIRNK